MDRLIPNHLESWSIISQQQIMQEQNSAQRLPNWYDLSTRGIPPQSFWSPDIFDRYVISHLSKLTALAHKTGKVAYVMTTRIEVLSPRLAWCRCRFALFSLILMQISYLWKVRKWLRSHGNGGGISSVNLLIITIMRYVVKSKGDYILGPTKIVSFFIPLTQSSLILPGKALKQWFEAWKDTVK